MLMQERKHGRHDDQYMLSNNDSSSKVSQESFFHTLYTFYNQSIDINIIIIEILLDYIFIVILSLDFFLCEMWADITG